jgi:hypothetical protein
VERVLRVGANLASALVGVVMVATAIGLIVLVRTSGPTAALTAGAPKTALTADQLREGAAAALDAALAKGGSGLTFRAVQRNTLHQKAGGPPIEVRSPADPTKVLDTVAESYVNAIVSSGAVTDSAFWMEMRRGPGKDEAPDFSADLLFSVVQRDGLLWRNDGFGWYQTDQSPGTGMDPVSARGMPALLRALHGAKKLDPATIDGQVLVGVRGIATPNDYPGVIAADGRDLTDRSFEVDCWFDDAGRLVQLSAHPKNVKQTTYDLVSETLVTFGYGSVGSPPEPTPTMAPEPLPTHQPGDVEVQS